MIAELLAAGEIVQMKDASGETDASVSVSTDFPGQTQSNQITMSYIVPDGFVKISANFETSHDSGDSACADWANGDPHNGDVLLSVHCSGVGRTARAAVNNAFAAKPATLQRLHLLAIRAKEMSNE